MAFNVSALTEFVEEKMKGGDIWTGTTSYAETLRQPAIDIFGGVKSNSIKLPKMAFTATIQDGDDCTFSASGDDTITQSTITLDNQ